MENGKQWPVSEFNDIYIKVAFSIAAKDIGTGFLGRR
jgi:hypothetical protein